MRIIQLAVRVAAIPLAALLLGNGCSLLRTPEAQINLAAERFTSATILYQIQPVPSAAAAPNATAAAPTTAPNPLAAGQTVSTLAIKYPHPSGRAGYARVELVVEKAAALDPAHAEPKTGWMTSLGHMSRDYLPGVALGDSVVAAYGMDLPISQLDAIVAGLQSQKLPPAAAGALRETRLSARINGVGADKPWCHVPELDALIKRTTKEGTFISHKGSMAQAFGTSLATPAPRAATATVAAPTPSLAPNATPNMTPITMPAPNLAPPMVAASIAAKMPSPAAPAVLPASAWVVEPLPKVEPAR